MLRQCCSSASGRVVSAIPKLLHRPGGGLGHMARRHASSAGGAGAGIKVGVTLELFSDMAVQ